MIDTERLKALIYEISPDLAEKNVKEILFAIRQELEVSARQIIRTRVREIHQQKMVKK